MFTNNCHQIGLQTESMSVVNPTLNLPVTHISDDIFSSELLINIRGCNLLNFKNWKVDSMEYLDQHGNFINDYYGYVYLIYDQKYNKVYIGQKKGKVEDTEDYYGSGLLIRRIVGARGTYFLKKTILGVCYSKKELLECETECKLFFHALNFLYGYNILKKDNGGDTLSNHPEKDIIFKKMSETRKEKLLKGEIIVWNKGKITGQEGYLKGCTKETNIELKKRGEKISKIKKEKNRKSEKKGKTMKEIYGEEKANEIKNKMHKFLKGKVPWNKGLTKETNEKLKENSRKMQGNNKGKRRVES